MSEKTFSNVRIIHKHDTEENWLKAINFIPKQGELIIYDTDDIHTQPRFKIGDGETLVSDLPFSQAQQPNWEQNDETALDYIQNRPFYSPGTFTKIDLLVNEPGYGIMENTYYLLTFPEIIGGEIYNIVFNQQEFTCMAKLNDNNYLYLGHPDPENWEESEYPFCILASSGFALLRTKPGTPTSCSVSISKEIEDIVYLDKKYVSNFMAGEKTEGQEVEFNSQTYTCQKGAEIFNSLTNKAIGTNSHAEGYINVALGDYSHVEGTSNMALGSYSHSEGDGTKAEGLGSHAEGSYTIAAETGAHAEGGYSEANGTYSHAEGFGTIAIGAYSHAQGQFNIKENTDKYAIYGVAYLENPKFFENKIVYKLNEDPIFDAENGIFTVSSEPTATAIKDLKPGDKVLYDEPLTTFTIYYKFNELVSTETNKNNEVYYEWNVTGSSIDLNTSMATYAHIVGNGSHDQNRSNAHTLDWKGNAWFAGDVYVGSTSGTNRDEGSKKLATEDFVKTSFVNLNSNTVLSFYCIEDVTIVTNGISKVYPANSNVEVRFTENDVFEIIPTSNNSIFALNAFPGALNTFYPWLEGVKQFSNILFDMNSEDMYTKWNQGNQGVYKVQFAQYVNCIFWSDNPYISEVTKRTNYTLYNTSQIPLCYSNIPENTFKSFYLALGVVSDPNWANPLYRESFANASWATQAFSYYGARTIGLPGLDSSEFNIVLPKDCRGLMFDAGMVENAGTFDAINVTDFGAKSGSWRDAFGKCTALRKLSIKNLKVNLDLSWSPIEYNSISYIISKAANTNKITISVSPYTYYLLNQADFELAAEKNITIELLSTHYSEDKRLNDIANKADKEYVDEAINSTKDDLLNGAGEAYDTLKELADLIDENHDAIDVLETVAAGKADATHSHVISEVTDLQNKLDTLTEHTANDDIHFTAAERAQLAEIADIITQAAYIDILDNEIITDTDTSGSKNIDVDSTLSETSENPVQNKVITNEINELNDKINKMLELSGGDTITIPNYLSGTKVIMSSYIKISNTPIPREALVNGGSYTITYLNTSKTQSMTFADRSVQNYLECATMFQFGAFITVVEDTDLYGEAVEAGLYADAFPYTPNTYASSLTLNEYDGFISEKIKESYLPSFDNKVDVKQGKANANHFVMTDENGDITASKLISDVFGFLTCSVTIDIDSSKNAILSIKPNGDREHVSYQLKRRNSFNSPSDSPKDFDYYTFDFNEGYTSSEEAIGAIRTIESCLNQGTFTNISINIYESDKATRSGGNGSYIVDAYEGISFGFGKTYVRITTNTAGQGSSEPE